MGSVGDCYDNSMAESWFATLECELFADKRFRNRTDARYEIMRFIDWYNHRRRHTSLDNTTPVQYEEQHLQAAIMVSTTMTEAKSYASLMSSSAKTLRSPMGATPSRSDDCSGYASRGL